eukprot:TRINITY_DN9728_c0_g1_i1.p1 TRINITY_DN9728_c0_g1~~TRINITY_DN9728_c0_g1_i1.p1  ORF type:complete len:344 (-),score=64.48 TRINITY_DN9728_c0_g1_i1:202-1233(-)
MYAGFLQAVFCMVLKYTLVSGANAFEDLDHCLTAPKTRRASETLTYSSFVSLTFQRLVVQIRRLDLERPSRIVVSSPLSLSLFFSSCISTAMNPHAKSATKGGGPRYILFRTHSLPSISSQKGRGRGRSKKLISGEGGPLGKAPEEGAAAGHQGGARSPPALELAKQAGAGPGAGGGGGGGAQEGGLRDRGLVGLPPVKAPPNQNSLESSWSVSLFGCLEDPLLCLSTCVCPCVTAGNIAERLFPEEPGRWNEVCGLYTVVLLLFCCPCPYAATYRSHLREKVNISGTPAEDCCVHYCCELCALCQEQRELEIRGCGAPQNITASSMEADWIATEPLPQTMAK